MTDQSSQTCTLKALGLQCDRGDRELFNDLSLSVSSGQWLQICGANGSGKTTLLRMLCGLIKPDAGEIHWQDKPAHQNPVLFRQSVEYIGHLAAVKPELSPLENLRFAAILNSDTPKHKLEDALDHVELYGFEHEPAYTLSAGQQRRIALARLLISPAKAWILDEPFNALDRSGVNVLESLIEQHLQNGGLAILASHMPINLPLEPAGQIQLTN